jgi:hypothetical protein
MKKLCIGLFGMLACSTWASADGPQQPPGKRVAGKDFPFPPEQGSLPEADEDTGQTDDDDDGESQEDEEQ